MRRAPSLVSARVPSGATLVELVVTIAVLGVMASVATLAIRTAPPAVDDVAAAVRRARSDAAERGVPIHLSRADSGRFVDLVAYPDGRVIADSGARVDPLTGRLTKSAQ
jgi:prepilin-type N-terminal cleavage/methylation domain-containing protein